VCGSDSGEVDMAGRRYRADYLLPFRSYSIQRRGD
jgi:hypothetical protein